MFRIGRLNPAQAQWRLQGCVKQGQFRFVRCGLRKKLSINLGQASLVRDGGILHGFDEGGGCRGRFCQKLGKLCGELVLGHCGHRAPDSKNALLPLFDHGLPGLERIEIQTVFPGPFSHVRILPFRGREQVLFNHRLLEQFGDAFIAIPHDLSLFPSQFLLEFDQLGGAIHSSQCWQILGFHARSQHSIKAVIVGGRNGVEFMVMAACTADRQSLRGSENDIQTVIDDVVFIV